jgi:hypothetical protein
MQTKTFKDQTFDGVNNQFETWKKRNIHWDILENTKVKDYEL